MIFFAAIEKDCLVMLDRCSASHGIITEEFTAHCLEVNFAPGKSEVQLALRGPHRRAAELRVHESGGIPFTAYGTPRVAMAVKHYKYLGSVNDVNLRSGPELAARIHSARSVVRVNASKVFRAGGLGRHQKFQFVASFVDYHLLVNCATWPALTDGLLQRLEARLLFQVRCASRSSPIRRLAVFCPMSWMRWM